MADHSSGALLTVATLGSPGTFAHQASVYMQSVYPALGELQYFSSMETVYDALYNRTVDIVILTEQTSRLGWDHADVVVAPLDSPVYVYGASVVPYNCLMLGREGTNLAEVDGVYGHGSIRQCRDWLDANMPGIPAVVHEKNSVEAARDVSTGDGSKVVVATQITGDLTGLVTLAEGIDGGATGNWWALSLEPHYFDRPEHVIVSARLAGDGALNDLIDLIAQQGFRVATVYSQASKDQIFEFDYLITGIGDGSTADMLAALEGVDNTRLVAAYRLAG
jgi:prephenate dehydratase